MDVVRDAIGNEAKATFTANRSAPIPTVEVATRPGAKAPGPGWRKQGDREGRHRSEPCDTPVLSVTPPGLGMVVNLDPRVALRRRSAFAPAWATNPPPLRGYIPGTLHQKWTRMNQKM